MKMQRTHRILLSGLAFAAAQAIAAPQVGQPAPDFTLTDTAGKAVRLSDFKGRFVVLEWTNPDCPYVVKHYGSANMPGLQKEFAAKEVVWLAINSTRAGHSEFKTPAQMSAWMKQTGGAPAATLIDGDSKVGRLYGATNTPHMYIVDPRGQLIYAGAIDDKRSTNPAGTANTVAYGCTDNY